MKPFTKIAAALFVIAVIIHVFRIINPFPVLIGGIEVPLSASYGMAIIGLVMCIGLWKESKK
jgi:hypothetical protein